MPLSETALVAGCHFYFAHPVSFQPCADIRGRPERHRATISRNVAGSVDIAQHVEMAQGKHAARKGLATLDSTRNPRPRRRGNRMRRVFLWLMLLTTPLGFSHGRFSGSFR